MKLSTFSHKRWQQAAADIGPRLAGQCNRQLAQREMNMRTNVTLIKELAQPIKSGKTASTSLSAKCFGICNANQSQPLHLRRVDLPARFAILDSVLVDMW